MRGRKPKPTHLKVLEGNPGRRPINGAEPKPAGDLPTCPAHLGPSAKAEWKRLARDLNRIGLLTMADRAALAVYCQSWGRWMADGLAHRARALRLLGNGVHPLAAAHAWRSLAAAHGLGPVDLAAERGAGGTSADEPL